MLINVEKCSGVSSVQTLSVEEPTSPEVLQTWTYTGPLGPNTSRQDAPHPHQAIKDPRGQFVLVPDLGSDLVRLYRVDQETLELTPLDPLVAAAGSGPRHGDFLVTAEGKVFFFLVAEVGNTVTTYGVTYPGNGTIAFEHLSVVGSLGADIETPTTATAAEIHITVSIPPPRLANPLGPI